jgi:hypothetical protein
MAVINLAFSQDVEQAEAFITITDKYIYELRKHALGRQ